MKKLIVFIGLSFLIILVKPSNAQIDAVVKLDEVYEDCLAGKDMYACAVTYYDSMDSLLNVVYKKLRSKLDDDEKAKLKTDEIKWIKEKEKKFKEINDNIDPEGGRDELLFAKDKKTKFIRDRVIYLINQLKKLK